MKVYQTPFLEQTNAVNQCCDTTDSESTTGEADQEYLIFAVVKIEIVADEAVSIANIGVDS